MLVDYHMHLERDDHKGRCRFTPERVEAYVAAARRRGVDEIAITEHCYRFREFRPLLEPLLTGEDAYPQYGEWAQESFQESLEEYVSLLAQAKEMGLPVKIGLEVDWVPGRAQDIAEVLRPYPWDILLGSVHFLGTWCVDYSADVGWPERDVDRVFIEYYRTLTEAASSSLFDVLAHPDLVKKFGHRPSIDMEPHWRSVARAAVAADCCVEVSTAGLTKPVREIYPSLDFLRIFREEGVPVTLASDAHDPEDVGRDLPAAVAWARQAGYDTVAVFEGRKRRLEPLG